MKYLLILLVLVTFSGHTQPGSSPGAFEISSGKYSWKLPREKTKGNILSTRIVTGSTRDMEYVEILASTLVASKIKTSLAVPDNEEHLLIIKSGEFEISFKDSSWSLGPGSIAVLFPGEKFKLSNNSGDKVCNFYLMKYRSREPVDFTRGNVSGGSFIRNWNALKFRQHDRGGVRSYFEQPTPMSKRFEMHVTTLNPGLKSHDPHTHRAEEIILMLEDTGDAKSHTEMLIGDKSFQGHAGDFYFVGSNLLHGIKNIGTNPCSYFAFQFE